MEELKREESNVGVVKISDEVISVIAGIAASEIKGIAGINANLAGGITQLLTGKKNNTKGVKVAVEEDSASIELSIVVEYGVKIPEVVYQVQDNVKRTVESMTGLNVSAVNIMVQSIIIPKQAVNNEKN